MKLSPLFCSRKINKIWQDLANDDVINHPQFGPISPNTLRARYANTPCPHCLRTMVHGSAYKTQDKEEAEKRNFFYRTKDNKKKFCQAGNTYFSNQYVTLDHKLNKARFPHKLFDADNLEAICWKCNDIKSDNCLFGISRQRTKSRNKIKKMRETINNSLVEVGEMELKLTDIEMREVCKISENSNQSVESLLHRLEMLTWGDGLLEFRMQSESSCLLPWMKQLQDLSNRINHRLQELGIPYGPSLKAYLRKSN